jgi:hypothetical protein
MTMKALLQELSNDFLKDHDGPLLQQMVDNGVIDEIAIKSSWLGYEPATSDMIEVKEKELGIELPSSYKEFLMTSNGFRFVSTFLNNLLPIRDVDWARNTEEKWWFDLMEDYPTVVPDELYLNYENQDCTNNRNEYYRQSLKISEWYDGMCIFLNPQIKNGDEWEVLEYATWYPGAERYRSFKEYLEKVHESNIRLLTNR